jgi:hypothetical protein
LLSPVFIYLFRQVAQICPPRKIWNLRVCFNQCFFDIIKFKNFKKNKNKNKNPKQQSFIRRCKKKMAIILKKIFNSFKTVQVLGAIYFVNLAAR